MNWCRGDEWQTSKWLLVGLFIVFTLLLVTPLAATAVGAQSATPDGQRVIDVDTERVNIYLQTHQVSLEQDESAALTFSAVNYVTNGDPLTIQLIVEAPSGVLVTSTRDVDSGSSQFTRVVTLDPGESRGLSIYLNPSSPGQYDVRGEAVYYFGDQRSTAAGRSTTISIEERPPPPEPSERAVDSLVGFIEAVPLSVLVSIPRDVFGATLNWSTTVMDHSMSNYFMGMIAFGFIGTIAMVVWVGFTAPLVGFEEDSETLEAVLFATLPLMMFADFISFQLSAPLYASAYYLSFNFTALFVVGSVVVTLLLLAKIVG